MNGLGVGFLFCGFCDGSITINAVQVFFGGLFARFGFPGCGFGFGI